MYLVIAEKPSVSRAIAEVIGAHEREDGYLQGTDCMVSWYVEAWYMKAKPTSIVATTIVTLLSGKITAICRAWKKPWIKRWLQNF